MHTAINVPWCIGKVRTALVRVRGGQNHAMSFTDPAAAWNARYAGPGFLFGAEPNVWLRQQASHWPHGQRVLCVADGEGRNSVWLAAQGHRVAAFDIAEAGVAKARALAAQQGVQVDYAVAGVDEATWPLAACDRVVAIFVQFADPAMRLRMLARMAAALQPGGELLLLGYGPRQLEYKTGGPGVLANLYTPQLLRAEVEPLGLEVGTVVEWDEALAEGPGHHGMSHLVALQARRGA